MGDHDGSSSGSRSCSSGSDHSGSDSSARSAASSTAASSTSRRPNETVLSHGQAADRHRIADVGVLGSVDMPIPRRTPGSRSGKSGPKRLSIDELSAKLSNMQSATSALLQD